MKNRLNPLIGLNNLREQIKYIRKIMKELVDDKALVVIGETHCGYSICVCKNLVYDISGAPYCKRIDVWRKLRTDEYNQPLPNPAFCIFHQESKTEE